MSIPVHKTYKLFVGGAFPRSESGRSYQAEAAPGINVPRASRKDLRDAVVAARQGAADWQRRTGYNRGQIIYRLGEMLQSHAPALAEELRVGGLRSKAAAEKELARCIDLCAWFAGIPDKLQQLCGSQNGVAGPFTNFSKVEAQGVIGVVAPAQPSLLGVLATALPLLAGGNAVVCLCSETAPSAALALGEALAVSDLPGGCLNLLSGLRSELLPEFASHRDIDGLLLCTAPDPGRGADFADSVKRVRYLDLEPRVWRKEGQFENLALLEPFIETKTFWHPIAP